MKTRAKSGVSTSRSRSAAPAVRGSKDKSPAAARPKTWREREAELTAENAALAAELARQKHSEGELRESEFFFRESQRAAFIGSYKTDFIKGFWESSEVLDQLFGIDKNYRRTVQGWLDIVHADDRDALDRYLREEVIGKRKPFNREYRITRKSDGETRWVNGLGAVDFDADGNIVSMIGTIQDITDRKRAAEALRETSQLSRQIIDSAQEGVIVYGKDLRYQVWNPFMENLSGRRASEVLGRHPLEVFPFLKEAGVIDRLERALAGEMPVPVEFPYSQGGRSGWSVNTSAPLRNANGEIIGVIGTVQEVTVRKRAEDALRKSEEEFRSLAEAMPQIVWTTTKDGLVNYFNQRWADYTGMTLEESYGHGWDIPFHPDDKRRAWDAWQGSIRNQRIYANECRLRRADGEYRWWLIRGIPVLDSEGTVLKWFGTCTDIDDIKRAEAEREKIQAQLLQAQKMESVGRLAGGVAHDFNNMLGVIMGHTDMALEQVAPNMPVHSDLQEIRKAAERSATLTRQLLAFARKQTVAPRVVDLNETVVGVLGMLRRLIGENISLLWRPGTDISPVKVDPSQIDQVLANLCLNARDAIGGVGKVTIETGNITIDGAYCDLLSGVSPGEYVRLAVSDNGCGMDADTKAHLFEPFFTTKPMGKGTGLGLATVYGVVKQNFGFIKVQSEPGRGTTIEIHLPKHQGNVAQADAPGQSTTVVRGHETVMLVEDEAGILTLNKRILEKLGYRVLAASTPGEAIRMAEEHSGQIHLLMTDVVMPEMNGRDLARRLLSLYPSVKRLFTSGYTADVIAHHGVLDEGVHFIQKPYSAKDLAEKVRDVLDRQ